MCTFHATNRRLRPCGKEGLALAQGCLSRQLKQGQKKPSMSPILQATTAWGPTLLKALAATAAQPSKASKGLPAQPCNIQQPWRKLSQLLWPAAAGTGRQADQGSSQQAEALNSVAAGGLGVSWPHFAATASLLRGSGTPFDSECASISPKCQQSQQLTAALQVVWMAARSPASATAFLLTGSGHSSLSMRASWRQSSAWAKETLAAGLVRTRLPRAYRAFPAADELQSAAICRALEMGAGYWVGLLDQDMPPVVRKGLPGRMRLPRCSRPS